MADAGDRRIQEPGRQWGDGGRLRGVGAVRGPREVSSRRKAVRHPGSIKGAEDHGRVGERKSWTRTEGKDSFFVLAIRPKQSRGMKYRWEQRGPFRLKKKKKKKFPATNPTVRGTAGGKQPGFV